MRPETALTGEVADAILKRWQDDPAAFCDEALGITLWEKQREIAYSVRDNPRTAVKSCHASGKSYTAAALVVWWLNVFPYSVAVTTAPTFRQVDRVLWPEIRTIARRARVPLLSLDRLLGTSWKIDDKWYGLGFSTDDPDSLQGIHSEYVLAVLDEASGVKSDLWPAVDGILSGGHTRLLSIGNPTDPGGVFYQEYASLPAHARFTISAFDTPNLKAGKTVVRGLVSPEWVADKEKRWGVKSPLYQARVLGEFPDTGTDALIPLSAIEAAQARHIPGGGLPAKLGVDVARYGDDETVFCMRWGDRARIVQSTSMEPTTETAQRAIGLATKHGAAMQVDGIGIGAGVVDIIKDSGFGCFDMNSSFAAADAERYANARAEWYWGLRERFIEGRIDIDPEDHDLAQELTALRYKIVNGRIQIESKDDIKKRLGRSPDRADALMLAFATPSVAPSAVIVGPHAAPMNAGVVIA